LPLAREAGLTSVRLSLKAYFELPVRLPLAREARPTGVRAGMACADGARGSGKRVVNTRTRPQQGSSPPGPCGAERPGPQTHFTVNTADEGGNPAWPPTALQIRRGTLALGCTQVEVGGHYNHDGSQQTVAAPCSDIGLLTKEYVACVEPGARRPDGGGQEEGVRQEGARQEPKSADDKRRQAARFELSMGLEGSGSITLAEGLEDVEVSFKRRQRSNWTRPGRRTRQSGTPHTCR
jgi:hypothetical protein